MEAKPEHSNLKFEKHICDMLNCKLCDDSHSQNINGGYCKQCQIFYCQKCSESHNDHFQELESIESACLKFISQFTTLVTQIKAIQNKTIKISQLKDQIIQQIEEAYAEVIQKIVDHKEAFVKQILSDAFGEFGRKLPNLYLIETLMSQIEVITVKAKYLIKKDQLSSCAKHISNTKLEDLDKSFKKVNKIGTLSVTEMEGLLEKVNISSAFSTDKFKQLFTIKTSHHQASVKDEQEFVFHVEHLAGNILLYYPSTNYCNKVKIPIKFPIQFAATQHKSNIYILGGEIDGTPLSCTYRYNVKETDFTTEKDMNIKKVKHSAVGIQNFIFSIGGKSVQERLNICEKYNIGLNSWNYISKINEKKSNLSSVCINEIMIYLFGGYTQENINSDMIEHYSILNESNGWISCPIKSDTGWTSRELVVLSQYSTDEIFMFGGYKNKDLKECYIYNIDENLFTRMIDIPFADSFFYVRQGWKINNDIVSISDNKNIFLFHLLNKSWDIYEEERHYKSVQDESNDVIE